MQAKKLILPPQLQRGDKVSLITPSFIATHEQIQQGIDCLTGLGLEVDAPGSLYDKAGYFAGTAEQNTTALHRAFKDPDIKAIIAVRGGYGSARLLEGLDYELIKLHPKILMGHSDLTALLLGIHEKTGLVTFHGPNASRVWSHFTTSWVRSLLFDKQIGVLTHPEISADNLGQTHYQIHTITGGQAFGRLIGGNLTVLLSLLGTPFFPSYWEDVILFIEDIHEHPYRVERMLRQLEMTGLFHQIRGLVFGALQTTRVQTHNSYAFSQIIDDVIAPLKIPAIRGAALGHQDKIWTLPVGVEVMLDADKGELRLKQAAVM